MVRRILFVLSVPFLLGALYFFWCMRRFTAQTFVHDKEFPRAWPYPDWVLLGLNDYYDKLDPAPPNSIKIHGEVMRVQATVGGIALMLGIIGLALALPFLIQHCLDFWRNHRNARHVVAKRQSSEPHAPRV
jgi:quinol-cytochrome oxidoreductase complex cytochrome b subunit